MAIIITATDARRIGEALGIAWSEVNLSAFQRGLELEWEYEGRDSKEEMSPTEELTIGALVRRRLAKLPDYYQRWEKLWFEARHDHEQATRRDPSNRRSTA